LGLGRGGKREDEVPSSRTSTIAIFEAVAGASRFEEVADCASRSSESAVEERRGRVATVWVDILRIRFRFGFIIILGTVGKKL
jgi:hypothetical protein